MNLDTFLLLQRQRVSRVDGGELEAQIRRSQFNNPEHHIRQMPPFPAEVYHDSVRNADTIRKAYKGLRILYE